MLQDLHLKRRPNRGGCSMLNVATPPRRIPAERAAFSATLAPCVCARVVILNLCARVFIVIFCVVYDIIMLSRFTHMPGYEQTENTRRITAFRGIVLYENH